MTRSRRVPRDDRPTNPNPADARPRLYSVCLPSCDLWFSSAKTLFERSTDRTHRQRTVRLFAAYRTARLICTCFTQWPLFVLWLVLPGATSQRRALLKHGSKAEHDSRAGQLLTFLLPSAVTPSNTVLHVYTFHRLRSTQISAGQRDRGVPAYGLDLLMSCTRHFAVAQLHYKRLLRS